VALVATREAFATVALSDAPGNFVKVPLIPLVRPEKPTGLKSASKRKPWVPDGASVPGIFEFVLLLKVKVRKNGFQILKRFFRYQKIMFRKSNPLLIEKAMLYTMVLFRKILKNT
jgi:hypothetical protein